MLGKGVDGFRTHTVEAHGFLECLAVEFRPRVQVACGLDHGIQRNPSSEVPDGHFPAVDSHVYLLAESGGEFIYGIVYDFLEKYV